MLIISNQPRARPILKLLTRSLPELYSTRSNCYCIPRGNKGFGNLYINFVRKKMILISTRTLHQLCISDEKNVATYRKIGKAYLVRNFLCLPKRRNPRQSPELGTQHSRPTEPTILLACGRNRELWLFPTPEVRNSRTSRQIWQIRLVDNTKVILCACSENRARALDSCHRPEGSWALGTRMGTQDTAKTRACLLRFSTLNDTIILHTRRPGACNSPIFAQRRFHK